MAKFLTIYSFLAHIVPFTLISLFFPKSEYLPGLIFVYIGYAFFILGLHINFKDSQYPKKETLNNFFSISALFAILFLIFLFRYQEIIDLLQALFTGGIIEYGVNNALERYYGSVDQSIFYRTSVGLVFCYSFLIGYFYQNRAIYIFFIFFFIFLIMFELFISLGRQSAFFMIISFFAARILSIKNGFKEIGISRILLFLVAFLLLLVLLWGVVQFFRGSSSDYALENTILRFFEYTLLPYQVFLSSFNDINEPLAMGCYTFMTICEVSFGFEPNIIYDRYYIDNDNYTNLYTIWLFFYVDFGVIGTCILLFIIGISLNLYAKKNYSLISELTSKALLCLIIFPYYSMLYSTTLVFGLILSSVIIKFKHICILK